MEKGRAGLIGFDLLSNYSAKIEETGIKSTHNKP